MNKILIFLSVVFYSLSAMVPSCFADINIAKGKHYSLSMQPNYQLSAPSTDTTGLTDGIYSVGFFWTKPTTVGWQNLKSVEIFIDLEKESNIGSISFSTARGGIDVNFPANIIAFVGSDRDHLSYAGDIAASFDNKIGKYKVSKFTADNINMRGRYVLLVVVSNGYYIFCDEIEVTESSITPKVQHESITIDQARKLTNEISRVGLEKDLLLKSVEDLSKATSDPTTNTRLQNLKKPIFMSKSANDIEELSNELYTLQSDILRAQYPNKSLLIRIVNPWAPLNPVSPIVGSSSQITINAPRMGYDSGAFTITNISKKPRKITISINPTSTGGDIVLYHVPFVKSAAREYVADPLVPISGDITLRDGESRMIFVTVFGKRTGDWNSKLLIKTDDMNSLLPINIHISNIELPNKKSLNSNNWAYMSFKSIRDRQQAAIADLLSHHTNVVVVPWPVLLKPSIQKTPDYVPLVNYIKMHKGFSKILLLTTFKDSSRRSWGGRSTFMDNQWKLLFKEWYKGLLSELSKNGVPSSNVYCYPYDEMKGKYVEEFIKFSTWAREDLPEIRLYATLNNIESLRALPYLDVAQIAYNKQELLEKVGATKAEIWLYVMKGPAKSQSPYSYYRLLAWKAFLKGYTGVGFWAYADTGLGDNPGTAWDDLDGKNPDYAVIYEGEGNTIVSSRRWEAWRMGIEDYELLTMYARAKGGAAAKALAKDVLDHPEDTTRADEVRRKILLQL